MSGRDNGVPNVECWAKTTVDGRPGIGVRDHCLNVGCVFLREPWEEERRRQGRAAPTKLGWKRVAARPLDGFSGLFPEIRQANSLQMAAMQTVREPGIYMLLTPFGVGTVDQALLGIVAAKHFFIRQFGLAGKVVILDEVHSHNLCTGTLIDVLVRRLRELHCTVIVLSATLTAARRRQLLRVFPTRVGMVGIRAGRRRAATLRTTRSGRWFARPGWPKRPLADR